MKEHILKCWPEEFAALRRGLKPFEFRKNDRDFQVGDTLLLREFQPYTDVDGGFYTGAIETRRITYVLTSGFGVPEGFAVLGVAETAPAASPAATLGLADVTGSTTFEDGQYLVEYKGGFHAAEFEDTYGFWLSKFAAWKDAGDFGRIYRIPIPSS